MCFDRCTCNDNWNVLNKDEIALKSKKPGSAPTRYIVPEVSLLCLETTGINGNVTMRADVPTISFVETPETWNNIKVPTLMSYKQRFRPLNDRSATHARPSRFRSIRVLIG